MSDFLIKREISMLYMTDKWRSYMREQRLWWGVSRKRTQRLVGIKFCTPREIKMDDPWETALNYWGGEKKLQWKWGKRKTYRGAKALVTWCQAKTQTPEHTTRIHMYIHRERLRTLCLLDLAIIFKKILLAMDTFEGKNKSVILNSGFQLKSNSHGLAPLEMFWRHPS